MTVKGISIIVALVVVAYLCGFYASPSKVKIEKQLVSVEAVATIKDESATKTEVITQVSKPDGTKIVRTRYVDKKENITTAVTAKEVYEKQNTEITSSSKLLVEALVGVKSSDLTSGFRYGVSVSRPILGPLTLGAWGLTDMTFGLSVGIKL